jgi:hypothetical protein
MAKTHVLVCERKTLKAAPGATAGGGAARTIAAAACGSRSDPHSPWPRRPAESALVVASLAAVVSRDDKVRVL